MLEKYIFDINGNYKICLMSHYSIVHNLKETHKKKIENLTNIRVYASKKYYLVLIQYIHSCAISSFRFFAQFVLRFSYKKKMLKSQHVIEQCPIQKINSNGTPTIDLCVKACTASRY